jgi:hypothetical protein
VLERTLLVTGLPRAGTTLTCELLNKVPDTVALDEPMDRAGFCAATPPGLVHRAAVKTKLVARPGVTAPSPERMAHNVERFLVEQRRTLLADGTAISKNVGGRVLGAKVADAKDDDGRRTTMARRGPIRIGRPLSPDFLLAAKHNSAFAGALTALAPRFQIHAVVRNPLAILASWQTVPFAVGRGHATLAELFHPPLAADLASIDDVLDRQVHLLSWFFQRFIEHLPTTAILRYEELIASDGTALVQLAGRAPVLSESLQSRNATKVYDRDTMARLAERLLADGDAPWRALYDGSDVEGLLVASTAG